jgi:anti-sigma regulatory factor (Ser/Thr protein kinase)
MKEMFITADTENLDKVIAFVDEQLRAISCADKIRMKLELATEEIFVNIANYAYDDVGEAYIGIESTDDKKCVKIIFKDSGIQYNPLLKSEPDVSLPAEKRGIGGLGILLVKSIADELSYEYVDGNNVLTVIKKI